MNDLFETWVKAYYPEQELAKLPSGNYRNTSTRLLLDGFNGAKEMIEEGMRARFDKALSVMLERGEK